jgi:hypothetical protein
MAIFGRRRVKDIKQREFFPPVDIREIPYVPEPARARPEVSDFSFRQAAVSRGRSDEQAQEKEQSPSFAPLFVKLTRYKQILSTLNYLKMSINLIKNQLAILSELDKLREENIKLLDSTTKRVGERLSTLDSEFMRPSGFMEEIPEMQMQDVESLESTLTDLKSQIEHLKSEVETIA